MKIIRIILIFLVILLITIPVISQMIIHNGIQGIDVSHHNTVRWDKVDTSKVKFAYIKITEGATFVDWEGKTNVQKAEKAGVMTGVYHYFSTGSSATKQFQNFRTYFVNESSLVPMVDVEDKDNISKADLNNKIKEFCLLIEEEYGVKPVIYTRPDLYYSVFVMNDFLFWSKYTFFFWQPIPIHPVFSTFRPRCIWQYSTNKDVLPGTSIIDRDVLSGIELSDLLR